MVKKTRIVKELGDVQLLLPNMISEALVANDRAKYFIALVQMAKDHADSPDSVINTLQRERLSSGVSDQIFDGVVKATVRLSDGRYQIPEASRILDETISCIEVMMKPLQSKAARKDSYQEYRSRMNAVEESMGRADGDILSKTTISAITSGQRKEADGLHLVVMDLHRELNLLQSSIYQETVEGASVYGLTENDKILVSAFMRGINETLKFKFDHPGLGTTVTRAGDELLIQNDIGQTESHVIVIKVKEQNVSITCTDIHRQRLRFLHSMLESFHVSWSDTKSIDLKNIEGSSACYLSTGIYQASQKSDLENFLSYLGSRLVFLVDWNRARKQLRQFVSKADAVDILRWAADENKGHIAFLKMGGDKLIFGAIEQLTNVPLRFGDNFYDVLGRKRANEFLKFVFTTCSEGLLQNKSEVLIRDVVRAELAESFHSIYEDLLNVAADHAALVVELATAVREDLVRLEGDNIDFLKKNAERGRKWENEADQLLNKVRLQIKRSNASSAFERMLSHSDDAADSLEDSLFLLTLVSRSEVNDIFHEPLLDIAEIATTASMEYLKAVENAKTFHKWSAREEIGEFLRAVDKVLSLEHDADDCLRRVKEAMVLKSNDFKQLQLITDISKDIEESTDALMKSAITLKDYILEELVGARE